MDRGHERDAGCEQRVVRVTLPAWLRRLLPIEVGYLDYPQEVQTSAISRASLPFGNNHYHSSRATTPPPRVVYLVFVLRSLEVGCLCYVV